MPRRARESGGVGDAGQAHVLRDEWLGEPVAFIYLPKHLLKAALISPSVVVVRDWAPLLARPFGEVVSAWGPTTFLIASSQASQLLADLGAGAALIDRLLSEIERALVTPVGQR